MQAIIRDKVVVSHCPQVSIGHHSGQSNRSPSAIIRWQNNTRWDKRRQSQNNTRRCNTRQGNIKATQDNTSQDNPTQDKPTQDNTRQHKTTQHKTAQGSTRQHKTRQSADEAQHKAIRRQDKNKIKTRQDKTTARQGTTRLDRHKTIGKGKNKG